MAKIEQGGTKNPSRAWIEGGCLMTKTPLPNGTLKTSSTGKSQILVAETPPAEFTIGNNAVRVSVIATVKTKDQITIE